MSYRRQGPAPARTALDAGGRGAGSRRPAWLRVVDLAAALAIVLLASPARPAAGTAPAAAPPTTRTGSDAGPAPDG